LLPGRLSTLETLLETFEAWRSSGQLDRLREVCRLRLRARPHLLGERLLLALCSEVTAPLEAIVAWDEVLYRAERSQEWEQVAGCLQVMGQRFPVEALSILDRVGPDLPDATRAHLQASFLRELDRLGEATRVESAAVEAPWEAPLAMAL
jgi:hypothetical protein